MLTIAISSLHFFVSDAAAIVLEDVGNTCAGDSLQPPPSCALTKSTMGHCLQAELMHHVPQSYRSSGVQWVFNGRVGFETCRRVLDTEVAANWI